jgi:hypothetical protein
VDIQHTYSFTAVYEDGTIIEQNETDTSERVEGKSRFTDVLDKENESKLVSFVIHNNEKSFGVDLTDGHFEVNGIPFFQHRPELVNYKDFRIIYFRTVQRVYNVQTHDEVSSLATAYTIGWQVTHIGENVQKTITALIQ